MKIGPSKAMLIEIKRLKNNQQQGIRSNTEIDRVLPNCELCLTFNPCDYLKPDERHPKNCVSFNAGHGQCKKSDSYKEIFFPREIKDAGF